MTSPNHPVDEKLLLALERSRRLSIGFYDQRCDSNPHHLLGTQPYCPSLSPALSITPNINPKDTESKIPTTPSKDRWEINSLLSKFPIVKISNTPAIFPEQNKGCLLEPIASKPYAVMSAENSSIDRLQELLELASIRLDKQRADAPKIKGPSRVTSTCSLEIQNPKELAFPTKAVTKEMDPTSRSLKEWGSLPYNAESSLSRTSSFSSQFPDDASFNRVQDALVKGYKMGLIDQRFDQDADAKTLDLAKPSPCLLSDNINI